LTGEVAEVRRALDHMTDSKRKILCTAVTYNCDERVSTTIASVRREDVSVLIVDNGSAATSTERIEQCSRDYGCHTIFNKEDKGIAFALNQRARYAQDHGYEWILTLDQDSLVTPGMVQTMLNIYEALGPDDKARTAGLFATPIERSIARPEDFQSDPENRGYNKVLTGITWGNLLRTQVFWRAGFFDERLFIDYVGHDFSLRLASAGYQLLECKGAKLIHQRGDRTERRIPGKGTATTLHSALRNYYITRNRMYLWKTYAASYPDFVRHDKKTFRKQLLKLLLVEDDRWAKLKMVARGVRDYRRNRFGKIAVE
jgi:rhamnosyltransferase